jgi:hypothetical protein
MTRRTNLVPWPDDFTLNPELRLCATNRGITNPDEEWEAFKDYHEAHGSRFVSWNAAWRTWCRNSQRFHQVRQPDYQGPRPIGFTKPASIPSLVQEALAENEQARAETQNMTVEERQAALRRLSAIRQGIKDRGEW